MKKIYILSGLSGCGKTTIGKMFVKDKEDWIFIDQDSFYLKDKPITKLSNGLIAKNWDTLDVIDWDRLNEIVINLSKTKNVLLVGFSLVDFKLKFPIHCHIHLKYTDDEIKNKELCCKNRQISKNFNNISQITKDELMVNEIVYPFYLGCLKLMTVNYNIFVYENNQRINIDILLDKLNKIIVGKNEI